MQLDRSKIAICERSWSENLDLALHVIRAHGAALAICALVGILPVAVLNFELTQWANDEAVANDSWRGFVYLLIVLVLIEAPLATAPMTVYLGQALFVDRPEVRDVARGFFSSLPQLILLQLILRVILIPPLVTWFIPFGLWPYLSEVILLERNPLVGTKGQISTLKRNSLLHRGNSGEFIAQALFSGFVAALLITALYFTQEFLLSNGLGYQSGLTAKAIELQVAIWLVVVYFTVARFLGYLDQRIRNEGWEVELSLRAERDRLTRHFA